MVDAKLDPHPSRRTAERLFAAALCSEKKKKKPPAAVFTFGVSVILMFFCFSSCFADFYST